METISNEKLSVVVSPHGAELKSIKDNKGKEYLWQADPRYWNRHSPILFPIVGTLWNGIAHFGNKDCRMGRHGFARDMDFKLIAKSGSKVTFVLHDDAETFEKYPFHFNLAISYRLNGNTIHVVWHVENTDDKTIHFQIGGHPAFNIPGVKPGEPMRGQLKLDAENPIRRFVAHDSGCLDGARHGEVKTQDGVWAFDESSFNDDALIFDHCQIREASLLDTDGKPAVTLAFKSPAVGIWSPYGKNAPFICIEPWYGVTDVDGYEGDFANRYLMNQLLPGASFMTEYTISING